MISTANSYKRPVGAISVRAMALTLRDRWRHRKTAAQLRALDRRLLNDVGITELPNGTFVKLDLNRRVHHE
jgi:uncharacterized protein YjiS (DUF1127 family)